MGEMVTTSVAGGVAAKALIPAAAFTAGAFRTLAPTAQQALRWTAGVGTESFVSTTLTDNRQGSVANAFGENAPLAVQPEDDMVSALGKSLIPNAGAEIALGLGFLGATKAVGRGLEGFDNVRRVRSCRPPPRSVLPTFTSILPPCSPASLCTLPSGSWWRTRWRRRSVVGG
jgi:hypothetical protein